MNGVIEKLLENWLDSASERSYQAVFVQMLSGQGYRVVHSTRHAALEYGKDILAIDRDGSGCAFQLKSHPGGKMTLTEFRDDVQPQLVQLMTQAIVFPGFPQGPHKSYLVTNGYFDEEVHRAVDDLIQPHYQPDLWGEGAVASLVPWLVWRRKHDATIRPDFEIAGLARAVVKRNQQDSLSPLASPYYSYSEIARPRLKLVRPGKRNAVEEETFSGSSFTAEPLMYLLVRTNLKQECKWLWPDFTRIGHRVCVPDYPWEYCTLTIKSGADQTKTFPHTYSWSELKAEAAQQTNATVPQELSAKPWLLALWWQVAPYRYTTDASRAFVQGVFPNWKM